MSDDRWQFFIGSDCDADYKIGPFGFMDARELAQLAAQAPALQAQVAALREALEKTPPLVEQMLLARETTDVAALGRSILDDVLRKVLADTAHAAQAHDARVRDAALEEAAKAVEGGRFLSDDAPTAKFAREVGAMLRRLKSHPPQE